MKVYNVNRVLILFLAFALVLPVAFASDDVDYDTVQMMDDLINSYLSDVDVSPMSLTQDATWVMTVYYYYASSSYGVTTSMSHSSYTPPFTSSIAQAYIVGNTVPSASVTKAIRVSVCIQVPASSSFSCAIIAGLYPAYYTVASTSTSSVNVADNSNLHVSLFNSYILSDSSVLYNWPTSDQNNDFHGFVIVPPHDTDLFLYVEDVHINPFPIPASTNIDFDNVCHRGGLVCDSSAIVTVKTLPNVYDSVLNNIYTRLGTINTNTSNTASRLTTVNTNLTSISSKLDTIITNSSNSGTGISTVNTNLSNIYSRLGTMNTNILAGNTSLSSIQSSATVSADRLLNIYNQAVQTNDNLADLLSVLDEVNTAVQTPTAMEKFEDDYISKFEDELSYVDDILSPSSSLMPGGGSVTDFASDLTSGMGLSGSSFDASEFSGALDAFSGSGAVSAGGPWEFFSQEVANSLSGDTSGVGLSDDDYIYAWLDQSQRRYGIWNSSSP